MKRFLAILALFSLPVLLYTPGQRAVSASSTGAAVSGDCKYVALTFDDGPRADTTSVLLDGLQARGVSATFFLIGEQIPGNEDLLRRMAAEGHQIGNHTYSHPDMSQISSPEAFEEELVKVEELYRKTTGEEMPRYYRPPRGVYSTENLRMAKDLGYQTFFWSLAYVDWQQDAQPTHEEAFEKLLGRIHPGAIVLLHNTSRTNGEILDELLTRWESIGYTFHSLEELTANS